MSKGFLAIRAPLQFLLTAKHWGIDYVVNIKIDSTLYGFILLGEGIDVPPLSPPSHDLYLLFCLFKVLA